ncbi:CD40 ligand [Diretmus argenteus]
MINTYQTSLAAPPVPPRLSRSGPLLLPATAPSHGHSRSLLRFLVGLVLLHLLLSLGGFIYLYHTSRMEKVPLEGSAESLSSGETSHKTMARMIVKQPGTPTAIPTSGYLKWNMDYSHRRNINYYLASWLTVLQPGNYYVYARVTFSRWDSSLPLASIVKLRESETGKETDVMKAYCSLEKPDAGQARSPAMCTASQGEVITLKAGNQLSVWVQDLSSVDYEEGATTFGMYKL